MQVKLMAMVLILFSFLMLSVCSDDTDKDICDGKKMDDVCVPANFDFKSFNAALPCENEGLKVCPNYDGPCSCDFYICKKGKWERSQILDVSCEMAYCHFYGYDQAKIGGGDEDCNF